MQRKAFEEYRGNLLEKKSCSTQFIIVGKPNNYRVHIEINFRTDSVWQVSKGAGRQAANRRSHSVCCSSWCSTPSLAGDRNALMSGTTEDLSGPSETIRFPCPRIIIGAALRSQAKLCGGRDSANAYFYAHSIHSTSSSPDDCRSQTNHSYCLSGYGRLPKKAQ